MKSHKDRNVTKKVSIKETVFYFFLMALGLAMVIYGVQGFVNDKEELERETKWECPILIEKGIWTFDNKGTATSPSGVEKVCEEIPRGEI